MKRKQLAMALEKLSEDFKNLQWEYPSEPKDKQDEKIQLWPGDSSEDIVICVA